MGKCVSYEHIKIWTCTKMKGIYFSSGWKQAVKASTFFAWSQVEALAPVTEYWRQDPLILSVLLDVFFWQSHIQGIWTSFLYLWGCLFPELGLSRCLRWPVSPKDDFSMHRQNQMMFVQAAKLCLHSSESLQINSQ